MFIIVLTEPDLKSYLFTLRLGGDTCNYNHSETDIDSYTE